MTPAAPQAVKNATKCVFRERLTKLRDLMAKNSVQAYLINRADEHDVILSVE